MTDLLLILLSSKLSSTCFCLNHLYKILPSEVKIEVAWFDPQRLTTFIDLRNLFVFV